jgi:uncharacterized DUF497 family protein
LDAVQFRYILKYVIFSWDDINREHVAKHGVSQEEAEDVIRNAQPPFPEAIDDEKWAVWGRTVAGRYLQVIYVLKPADNVAYESVAVADWMSIEAGTAAEVVRVIHAMDLTPRMKKRLRRRWR